MRHSELPWAANYKGSIGHIKSIASIENMDEKYPLTPTVCHFQELNGVISKEEAEANAAFIVKAVNNHYQLLEALKKIVRQTEDMNPPFRAMGADQMIMTAREAIKKVGEL